MSSSILISSRITPRSRVISPAAKTGFSTMSLRISMATGRCSSSTFMLKQTVSLPVKASMLPPMESTCRAMSSARAAGGSLEHHVLDEMRDAVDRRIFVARAGLHPDAHRYRTNVVHLLGNDGETVGEHLTLNIAKFFYHSACQMTPLPKPKADNSAEPRNPNSRFGLMMKARQPPRADCLE